MLAARIGCFYPAERRRRIVPVYSVYEGHTGLAGFVRTLDNHVPDVGDSVEFASLLGDGARLVRQFVQVVYCVTCDMNLPRQQIPLARAGILYDVQGIAGFQHPLHPVIGDFHRDIEVGEGLKALFGVQEFEYIRMLDAHHTHVRAPAERTLLDCIGGLGKYAPEAYRPGGSAAAGSDSVARRS